MGLMQLLAVGRSLGKIGDQPSRYKMTQQSLLPKFGSVKAPEEQAPVGEVKNQVAVKPGLKQSSSEPAVATNDRKQMNAVLPKPQETTVPATTSSRPAFPLGRWTLFKNPFTRPPKPKPAARAADNPVQPELSLDTVKPVRNDLSDADLELVQAARKVPAKTGVEQSQAELAGVVAEGASWSRVKAQFFGAGKA